MKYQSYDKKKCLAWMFECFHSSQCVKGVC